MNKTIALALAMFTAGIGLGYMIKDLLATEMALAFENYRNEQYRELLDYCKGDKLIRHYSNINLSEKNSRPPR